MRLLSPATASILTWIGDTNFDMGPGAVTCMAARGTGGPGVGVNVGSSVGARKVAVAVTVGVGGGADIVSTSMAAAVRCTAVGT
jgi:hypothetical protein